MTERTGPLSRFTVLDLTRVRSGPTAVRQFADWGADVIKVEAPVDTAQFGGPRSGPDFQNLHRNKRSLTLDLKTEEGQEVLGKLIDGADVLVEHDNDRPLESGNRINRRSGPTGRQRCRRQQELPSAE